MQKFITYINIFFFFLNYCVRLILSSSPTEYAYKTGHLRRNKLLIYTMQTHRGTEYDIINS